MTKKIVIGPSSSSFASGRAVVAESTSQCPRYFLARKRGFKTSISPLYGAMGEIDEHRWVRKYQRANKDDQVETQIQFEHPISDMSKIFGYIDIKIKKADGTEMIVEKKSHISKNQRLTIIRKKTPKLSHVSQIVTYMTTQNITKGIIACDFYEMDFNCTSIMATEGIEFQVEINPKSRKILIDGEPYRYDLNDLGMFYKLLDQAIQGDTLPPRPIKGHGQRSSVCAYCPLAEYCDEADVQGLDKDEFLSKVENDLDRLIKSVEGKQKRPEIWAPARKPKESK